MLRVEIVIKYMLYKPRHWAQVVNELPVGRIAQENRSSIPGGNKSWSSFTCLVAEL
jgi:hypothetical protein